MHQIQRDLVIGESDPSCAFAKYPPQLFGPLFLSTPNSLAQI